MKEQIAIPFKKKTILLYAAGALLFVLAASLMLSFAFLANGSPLLRAILLLVGLAGVLFFGLIVLVLLPKLFINKPGLILTDEGLWDQSTSVSAGFVAWKDIRKINYSYSGSNVFLVVMVNKPEQYIARQTNPLKRWAMRMNYKISGTPIQILVSFLNTNTYALNDMIASKRYSKQTDAGVE